VDVYLYVERDTRLHRLDPRTKFALLVAAILLAVAGDHPALPLALQVLALVGIHAAGAWRSLLRVKVILVAIFLVSVVVWTFFSGGETPIAGPLQMESLMFGVATGLKLTGTITASVLWLSTTRNEEIAAGMVAMGTPHRMAFAFSAALRMVPTFVGAGLVIVQAQRARGLEVDAGGPIRRLRAYAPLVVPIFASALRSASHQAMALEARGFGARSPRTRFLPLAMRSLDWLLVALSLVGIVTAVWIAATGALRIPGLIR
jgi:energy-coupling factor transport system permease protein